MPNKLPQGIELPQEVLLNELPQEMLFKIMEKLPLKDLFAIAKVNKRFNEIIKNNLFWQRKCERDFPDFSHFLQGANASLPKPKDINWYDEYNKNWKILSMIKRRDINRLANRKESLDDVLDKKYRDRNSPLTQAQKEGNQHVLDYFYSLAKKYYSSPDGILNTGEKLRTKTILYWAIVCRQNYEQIAKLLSQGSRLDEKYFLEEEQRLPIHLVAQLSPVGVVEKFIKNNPELLEQIDASGWTPLMHAINGGNGEVINFLISKGANTALYFSGKRTFIHYAVTFDKPAAVKALIEYDPGLLNQLSNEGTPLAQAAYWGRLPIVEYLLTQKGIDLTQKTESGKTAFHMATEEGHNEVVYTLLKYMFKHNIKIDLSKPIELSPKLSKEVKAKIELFKTQREEPHTLFSSSAQEIAAANALCRVIFADEDKSILDAHQGALKNGLLKSIYDDLQPYIANKASTSMESPSTDLSSNSLKH